MSLGYNLEIVDYPYSDQLDTEQIATLNTGNAFLRPVIHGVPKKLRDNSCNLSDCLSAMDEHYQYLARSIGGKVVNHKWVLTNNTANRSKTGSHAHSKGLILFDRPGLWLGAVVDWVPGKSVSVLNGYSRNIELEAHFKLREAVVAWKKHEGWSILPGELTDASQFLSSTEPKVATFSELNPVLVDIDII